VENEQSNLEMSFNKQDLITTPELIKATITSIEPKLSREVFGVKATKPDQKVIVIHYENKELTFKGDQTLNHYPVGKVPSKSKLGKFITKYDGLRVGIEISLLQNKNGYYNIVLE